MDLPNEMPSGSFSADRLRLAMDLGGFASFASLEEASGVSSDTLRGWAKGRIERPSPQSREAIEETLPVTFEFLTDPTPLPNLTSVNFRSLRSTEDRARSRMSAYMSVLAWVTQNIIGRPNHDVDAVREAVGGAERVAGAVAAGQLRRKLGIGQSPIADVIALAEGVGVIVAYGPRQTTELDACSARVGAHALIALNPSKGEYYRQRWDVAHELGHLVMHGGGDRPESNRTREAQADGFAEALLYPASNRAIGTLREGLRLAERDIDTTFELLLALQHEWGISVDALLQVMRKTARGSGAKSAMDSLKMKRLNVAPKTQPVGDVRQPEQPRLLQNALRETADGGQMRAETLAFKLGFTPAVLGTMMAAAPREVEW